MAEKKLVSIDVDGIKEKATSVAKNAGKAARTRAVETSKTLRSKAKVGTEKALSLILSKGIELSEKQVQTLKSVQKKLG